MKALGWIFLLLIGWFLWKVFPSQTLMNPPNLSSSTHTSASTPTAPMKCTAADFSVEDFKPSVYDDCKTRSCPVIKFIGHLVNRCQVPAGAQLKITAYDRAGTLMDTIEGWPASTRNLAPGEKYPFDMSHMMTYRKGMHQYSVQVIDARTWGR